MKGWPSSARTTPNRDPLESFEAGIDTVVLCARNMRLDLEHVVATASGCFGPAGCTLDNAESVDPSISPSTGLSYLDRRLNDLSTSHQPLFPLSNAPVFIGLSRSLDIVIMRWVLPHT